MNATAGVNGPMWVAGRRLGALEFDGGNDNINLAANLQPVLGVGPASLAVWVRTLTRGAEAEAWRSPGITGAEIGSIDDIFWGKISQTGRFSIQAGDTLGAESPAAPLVSDGAWHHLVFTYDAAGNTQLYQDGVATAVVLSSPGPKTTPFQMIGRMANTDLWDYYVGALDDLRIYNVVLLQADVNDLLNTPPVVNAGADQTINFGATATLTGTITDDGYPAPAAITQTWTQVSGPAGATINTPSALTTTVTFTQAGVYVFRLTGSDGRMTSSDDVTVDVTRITVTPTSGLITTEAGGTATFSVVLNSQPTMDVTIQVTSSNTAEGLVSSVDFPTPAASLTLTFTNANWNVAQVVTLTGVDDFAPDGDILYTIVTGDSASGDANFDAQVVPDVTATNTDDDTPGITVTPVVGLTTTEAGGTATFTIVLDTQPQPSPGTTVAILVTSSNPAEGLVSTTGAPAASVTVTFDGTNWNVPQTVTLTGVDDAIIDFSQAYTITTGAATSADAAYDGMDPMDVAATNLDDEVIPAAPEAWGNCGFLGVEFWLPLGLLWLRRRRCNPSRTA